MSKKMNVKKHIIVCILVFLLCATPMLFSLPSKKTSVNVSKLIEKENINDMSLIIYYLSPYDLMFYPVSSVEDLIHRCDEKIVVNGRDLEEHIDLFKKISNDVLIPVKKKSSNLDLRVYYVLESKKNGKLFDVAMWGNDKDSIFVNGFEVKGNNIFGDIILPFLPENEAEELNDYIMHGRDLSEE